MGAKIHNSSETIEIKIHTLYDLNQIFAHLSIFSQADILLRFNQF
ncbi:hypothetical protein F544_22760 [Bibersteinia trehalosi USDA-ARS-USMARC-190]|uniref:Uncharacterized protein n=1 Tax=Bibersteinia trehalosi USDA-ARS-USMARC-190 TaxID=1263832 RepID=W0R8Q3_BIBTR|nr:hypothetical protein F544_22760 [Bibersteinia trehalosi USDA-ARS-USMARC-190]